MWANLLILFVKLITCEAAQELQNICKLEAMLISFTQQDLAPAINPANWLTPEQDRLARQTSVVPSSSRPEASHIEFTQPWTSALATTLQKGIETAKQSQREQQHLPVLHNKAGSRAYSLSPSCMGALGSAGCCQTWGLAILTPEVDEQQLTRAERLSLLTVKAHEYTLQYQQIVSTGLLKERGSQDLCSAWTAGFNAAVSAAYLSLKPSMHTTINQALMDRLPSSLLNGTSLLKISTADGSTADTVTLLAHSQSKSDQVVLATSESARKKHSTGSSTVWHPGRVIKAAWGECPKHNSVVPLPLPDPCNSRLQTSSHANPLQDCSVSGHALAQSANALNSGLEELRWHQGMLQRWPPRLYSAYALAILTTATQWLQSLQLASVSPNTTMQLLCQTTGSAAQLMDLADSVHQLSVQMQQTEQDSMGWEVGLQAASCQASGVSLISQLSSSIAQLHLQAMDSVVFAGIDHDSWQSFKKPMTWPDAPGHAVRLWRNMLLSLRQTLLQSCPTATTLDVLGATLRPAARCITAKYSKLQPSQAWQARLAADVWHITETCRMIIQPIGAVGSLQDMSMDVTAAVSNSCQQLCLHFSLQEQPGPASPGEDRNLSAGTLSQDKPDPGAEPDIKVCEVTILGAWAYDSD